MKNKVQEHVCEVKEFAKFAGKCGFINPLGICFRDATEDKPGKHELYPCEIKNCHHTQWIKIKKEIDK